MVWLCGWLFEGCYEYFYLSLQVVLVGQGIVIVLKLMVIDDLKDGWLIVFEGFWCDGLCYYLLVDVFIVVDSVVGMWLVWLCEEMVVMFVD